jgi:urease accessory protein
MNSAALLLLGDSRFPAGAHAHSGGLEAAAALERVDDVESLNQFLLGRLATVGLVAAAFAAASCDVVATSLRSQPSERDVRVGVQIEELDAELDARTPSPVLRAAAHRLGRQMLRTARRVWPHPALDAISERLPNGPQQPVALGAVAAVAGLAVGEAAMVAVYDAVMSPATAAVRLLGLDPVAVHATVARLGDAMQSVAAGGAAYAGTPPAQLPSSAAPLLDICAERHATWEVRLFAS